MSDQESIRGSNSSSYEHSSKTNADFLIAEYSSLRDEIQLRLSQQVTICEIAITVWGVIIGYALGKIDDLNSYNDVYLILAHPILVFFISYTWAFNNMRIGQIAGFLRNREKQFAAENRPNWETHVYQLDQQNKNWSHDSKSPIIKAIPSNFLVTISGPNKVKPGVAILVGTQILSIIFACILILVHFNNSNNTIKTSQTLQVIDTNYTTNAMKVTKTETTKSTKSPEGKNKPNTPVLPFMFLIFDVGVMALTKFTLDTSERVHSL